MESGLLPTDNTARYWKYMHLLVDAGTLVLRGQFNDQLNKKFPGTDLAKFLNSSKATATLNTLRDKKILKQEQYDLLYPTTGQPDLSKFDTTLILCLLRSLFSLNDLKKPTTANDLSIQADLYRLRQSRNEQAHPSNTAMTESEFQEKWQDLEQILLRLGSNIPDLQGHIDTLEVAAIEPAKERELLKIKESWQALQEQVDAVVTVVADHGTQITDLREDFDELKGMKEEFQEAVAETVPEDKIPPKLKHLISSSKDFLDNCVSDDVYVETASYEKAKQVLADARVLDARVLVISGLPGEGKTTMAQKLAIELTEPGKKCIVLTDPEDWKDVDTDKVPISYLLIDDIFGAGALDRTLAKRWESSLRLIQRHMNRPNVRFGVIITTRHYILEEASTIGRFDNFFKDKNIVNLSSKDLSKEELSNILNAYLRKSNRDIAVGLVERCIKSTDSSFYRPFSFTEQRDFTFGFPQCVDMFVNNDALFDKGSEFFNKPNELFMDVLEGLKRNSDDDAFLAIILTWARNGKPVLKCELNCHSPSNDLVTIALKFGFSLKNPATLKKVLRCLEHHKDDVFDYKPSTGAYTFSHNVIKHMVGLVLGKEYQEQTLEYSSRDFIMEYLTTDEKKNNKYRFYVEEHLYTKLSHQLIKLLQMKQPIEVGRCPKVGHMLKIDIGLAVIDAFKDKKFVKKFEEHANIECPSLMSDLKMLWDQPSYFPAYLLDHRCCGAVDKSEVGCP